MVYTLKFKPTWFKPNNPGLNVVMLGLSENSVDHILRPDYRNYVIYIHNI